MWQSAVLVVLLALMAGLGMVAGENGDMATTTAGARTLAASGFILLAAWTVGALFKRVGIPALLGYLVAGIAFGPRLAALIFGDTQWALFDESVISDLAMVNALAVGVIGTMGGGELKISDVRENLRQILVIVGMLFAVTLPVVIGVVMALASWAPGLAPFLADQPLQAHFAAAMLLAILAIGMSPAATIALLQELRAKGRFTSLVLGIVVVLDLVLVATFLFGVAMAELLISPEGLSLGGLAAAMPAIAAEFGWALVIGLATGGLFILYLRFVHREMLLFSVGMIILATWASKLMHAETLLVFLTAGFVVQNFSRHGHALIHAFEQISLPVFVVYFMTQAASLDLQAVAAYVPLTVILVVTRVSVFAWSIRKATALVGADEQSQRYLWMSFFSQGGVDLVLAAMVASRIPGWGVDVQTVVMATVIVYIIGGPPFLKHALDRAGETEGARRQGTRSTEEDVEELPPEPSDDCQLEIPELEDTTLEVRVRDLRGRLESLVETSLVGPAQAHAEFTDRAAQQVREVVEATVLRLRELETGEGTPEERAVAMRRLHAEYRESLDATVRSWIAQPPMPTSAEAVEAFFVAVQSQEPFASTLRVEREEVQFETSIADPRVVRAAKVLRRARRTVAGPGYRTVPVGRLWRFYVALGVPASVQQVSWSACQEFWTSIGGVLAEMDRLIDRAADREEEVALRRSQPAQGERRARPRAEGGSSGGFASWTGSITRAEEAVRTGASRAVTESSPLVERPVRVVDLLVEGMPAPRPESDPSGTSGHGADDHGSGGHGTVDASASGSSDGPAASTPDGEGSAAATAPSPHPDAAFEAALRGALSRLETNVARVRRLPALLRTSVAGPWAEFVRGCQLSGQIELPAFRYRPSSRFDSARLARERVVGSLEAKALRARGRRDELILAHELLRFEHWFQAFSRGVGDALDRFTGGNLMHHVGSLRSRCAAGLTRLRPPAEEKDWDELARELVRTSSRVEANALPPEGDAPPEAWKAWYRDHVSSLLTRMLGEVEVTRGRIQQGGQFRQKLQDFERRVEGLPESLLLMDTTAARTPGPGTTATLPLRRWFLGELETDLAVLLAEAQERSRATLGHAMVELERVLSVLNYHVLSSVPELDADTASRGTEAIEVGLERASIALAQLAGFVDRSRGQNRQWLEREMNRRFLAATQPLAAHRLDQVRRWLARRDASRGVVGPTGDRPRLEDRIRASVGQVVETVLPTVMEIREGLREALGETTLAQAADVRLFLDRVDGQETTLPNLYRRLFSPLPVELPELHVPIPEVEIGMEQAFRRWEAGRHAAILVHGDYGSGTTSLVQRWLTQHAGAVRVQTVSPAERWNDEAAWAAALTPDTMSPGATTFEEVTARIEAMDARVVYVVDHIEKLLLRTPEGVERARRFLELVSASSDRVFWVVCTASPAAEFLEATVRVRAFFPHEVRIPTMRASQIEALVMSRHHLSGYAVEFPTPPATIGDRLLRPLRTARALRDPRGWFFGRMTELAAGNPRQAIYLWLRHAELVGEDRDTVRAMVPSTLPETLVKSLSVQSQLVAAALVQHGVLMLTDLPNVMRMPRDAIDRALIELEGLNLLDPQAPARAIRLHPAMVHPLTRALRALNQLA